MIDGGHLVARGLKNEGVRVLFTLCGGHVMSIYNGCLDEGIKVIDVRHEQAAAHAADAWARVTKTPGIAVVTAGPGVTDSVTGVTNAFQAESPIIVFGGQGPLSQMEKGALQEMDHVGLMRCITKWSRSVHDVQRIPEYIATAFRESLSFPRGPAFIEIPVDVLFLQSNEEEISFPEKYREAVVRAADQCLVKKQLEHPPHIEVQAVTGEPTPQ